MQIIAKCPSCGESWLLDAGAADRRIKCRECCRLFKVPDMVEVSKGAKVIKRANGEIYIDKNGKTYG